MEIVPYKELNYKGKITPEDLLSKLTGCQIFNYGVGAYGSDQAFIKFQTKVKNKKINDGDFVILFI